MSKRSREWSETFADYVLSNSPGITKSAGARSALVQQFTPHGQIMAAMEKTARKLDAAIKDNGRLLAAIGRLLDDNDAMTARLRALDDSAYKSLSGDGNPRLTDYVPEEWAVHRAGSLVRREMGRINGNGHHAPQE